MDEAFYRKQRETMARVVAGSDVVITAAAVPGRKSPILVTNDMVDAMRAGSVIVDIAAEQGGNCEATVPGEDVTRGGVTVMGPLNLASTVPFHASQLYAKNAVTLVLSLLKNGALVLDPADEIVRETLVIRGGEVLQPAGPRGPGHAPALPGRARVSEAPTGPSPAGAIIRGR